MSRVSRAVSKLMAESARIRTRGDIWKSTKGQTVIDACVFELSWAIRGPLRANIIKTFAVKLGVSIQDMEDMLRRKKREALRYEVTEQVA